MDCLPRRQAQSAAVCFVAPPRATCRFLVAGLRLARQPFVGDSDRVSDYWCVMPAWRCHSAASGRHVSLVTLYAVAVGCALGFVGGPRAARRWSTCV